MLISPPSPDQPLPERPALPHSLSGFVLQRIRLWRRPLTQRRKKLRSSAGIFVRHLDCGSCNGCELALRALLNPMHDAEALGVVFVPSPLHASLVVMTGVMTHGMNQAAQLTVQALPVPQVLRVGDCAINGGMFAHSYASAPLPPEIEQHTVACVPGCPPEPEAILEAIIHTESQG